MNYKSTTITNIKLIKKKTKRKRKTRIIYYLYNLITQIFFVKDFIISLMTRSFKKYNYL
jgi:hypothetical protein